MTFAKEHLKKSEVSGIPKNSKAPAIHYDCYRLSAIEWGIAVGKGSVLATLIAFSFYRSVLIWGVLLLVLGAGYPFYEKHQKRTARLRQLANEFKECALLLAGALSTGYSIENAFTVSIQELDLLYGKKSLMLTEMKRMEAMIKINCPVEQVLMEFGERSGLEDVKNFAQVFVVAKRSGGQLADILRNTAEVIREKVQVQEEIKTLTAARQFEQRIMNLLPCGIIAYMNLTSPGFLDLMYETMVGKLVMTLCLLVCLTAMAIAGKILDLQV